MNCAAASGDWAATVEAIVRGAPASASQPHDLRTQVRLLALLSSAAPLNTLLEGLATYVETWAEGLQCAVLLVDPSGRLLLPAAAPSLPAAFARAIPQVPIGEGQGSCGTAAARRELVIVEDIESSTLWVLYAPIVLAHGLRACWSMPVFDDSRALLGTLALYYRESRAPSAQEIELIQFASSLAALVIQRHRDTQRLRTSESRLEAAVWGTNIGLWEAAVGGDIRWFDDWCERCDIDPCNGPGGLERWHSCIHPDDVGAYIVGDLPRWYDTTSNYTIEYRIRSRSGAWRWIHERGKVTARNGAGAPLLFSGVCIDIDARKQTEAALRRAEDRYELAINAARLPVWEYDVAEDTFTGNAYWHAALGRQVTEQQARECNDPWLSDIHPGDRAALAGVTSGDIADPDGFYEYEFRIRTAGGDYKWLMDRGRVVERAPNGAPRKVIGISLDIDARRQMELALRASLHEKEVLLQEVHHRVKNNLQIISSLMNMQLRRLKDASAQETLAQCQHRVQAIALIHEKLYQSKSLANVPLTEYVRSLARDIFQSANVSQNKVSLELSVEDIALAIDAAIPCGLILNELITNALKHGFPDERQGVLRISFERMGGDQLRLAVADNGIGLPAGFDIGAYRSMGLQLVRTLADQLGAQLEVQGQGGAFFQLTFPAHK